jgi:glycine/D-amino acid oxidase-like deaminating enzyme
MLNNASSIKEVPSWPTDYADVVVVGGGFYGLYIAEYFALKGQSVLLVEKASDFMQRASLINQARVHQGYHYPRSVLTALRSRVSYKRFVAEFSDCIVDSFEKFYLVGKQLGKITASQFVRFCERIGAPCEPASPAIEKLVNPSLIDGCFATVECAFDAARLKELMIARLKAANVSYHLETVAQKVRRNQGRLEIYIHGVNSTEQGVWIRTNHVFNATYSRINHLLSSSELALIPLKHELTEMCLVDVPPELKNLGLTVMCGPFFSCMPFPVARLHSLSHVRYTPHWHWYEGPNNTDRRNPALDGDSLLDEERKFSAWSAMRADARRYIPLLGEAQYKSSIWEVKTVLPRSEIDDSRPILFKANQGIAGLHCVMGGKIDNIYDVIAAIEQAGIGQVREKLANE